MITLKMNGTNTNASCPIGKTGRKVNKMDKKIIIEIITKLANKEIDPCDYFDTCSDCPYNKKICITITKSKSERCTYISSINDK